FISSHPKLKINYSFYKGMATKNTQITIKTPISAQENFGQFFIFIHHRSYEYLYRIISNDNNKMTQGTNLQSRRK
ncbi:hypothetical protein, partial [Staphylococcus aureus]|uniref:hypothetical protein n=1 Tax=Staphylococcus aureus TaxID=1280 RepID=UPI001ED9B24A